MIALKIVQFLVVEVIRCDSLQNNDLLLGFQLEDDARDDRSPRLCWMDFQVH
jgi:hypothetical protein